MIANALAAIAALFVLGVVIARLRAALINLAEHELPIVVGCVEDEPRHVRILSPSVGDEAERWLAQR